MIHEIPFCLLLVSKAQSAEDGFNAIRGLPGNREASGEATVIGHSLEGLGDSGGRHESGVLAILAGLPGRILEGDGVGFVHGFALGRKMVDG
jgi:hypothetical protein